MEPNFFKDGADFRKWLEQNHKSEKEVFVGFFKVGTGKAKLRWSDAVDQALCFGWIDSVMRPIDNEKYALRFTPRKQNSIWSAVNIKKVAKLTELGLMEPAGIAAFEKRTPEKSAIYSFENEAKVLDPEYEKRFRENKKAWDYFSAQPQGYRKLSIYHVMSAKQEKTRLSRLQTLIDTSESQNRL